MSSAAVVPDRKRRWVIAQYAALLPAGQAAVDAALVALARRPGSAVCPSSPPRGGSAFAIASKAVRPSTVVSAKTRTICAASGLSGVTRDVEHRIEDVHDRKAERTRAFVEAVDGAGVAGLDRLDRLIARARRPVRRRSASICDSAARAQAPGPRPASSSPGVTAHCRNFLLALHAPQDPHMPRYGTKS